MEKKDEISERLNTLLSHIDLAKKKTESSALEKQTYNPDFWADQQNATQIMKAFTGLKKQVEDAELMQLLLEEGDLNNLEKLLDEYEIILYLSSPHDQGAAIFSIHSGQGGTEAMDWAEILYRMYMRCFERKKFKVETIDYIAGEEAGIKTVVMQINGEFAYGLTKSEAGTHRLVRLSPFNAQSLRQTSLERELL